MESGGWTYDVVLDAVDGGIGLVGCAGLLKVVLDPVDAQHADLVEGPAAHALGELAVEGLGGRLAAHLAGLDVEPLVLQHLGRADEREARRVARLEGRDQGQLLAGGEDVVDHLALLLGVVAVGGARGAEDRGEELGRAEGGAHAPREGEDLVLGGASAEEVLHVGAEGAGRREEEHVVGVGRARGVVVEVVDHQAGALGGELDVELGEEGDERGGGRVAGAQGD